MLIFILVKGIEDCIIRNQSDKIVDCFNTMLDYTQLLL